ncbi:synaptic plasticity regulator PANTS [Genypterus blacodes]|uniref:synaptic plasticity regulator PANTS n=1 Tax=Genypterus blacodes TaxID=154954 RepID=UPI003F75D7CB
MEGSGALPWKPPRACDDYLSEFKHCKSLWNRFHHYYAHGTLPSCQQWREDHSSCTQWEKHRSKEAQEALQRSERNRLAEQGKFPPVWELRQEPPREWNLPLNYKKPQDS